MGGIIKWRFLLVGVLVLVGFVIYKETIETNIQTVIECATSKSTESSSNLMALNQEMEVLKAGQVAYDSQISILNDSVKGLKGQLAVNDIKVNDLKGQLAVLREQVNDNKSHLLRGVAATSSSSPSTKQQEDAKSPDVVERGGAEQVQQQQKPINPPEQEKKDVLYSRARTDRAGATVMDMLMAHAYAYSKGAIYGGACRSGDISPDKRLQQEERDDVKHTLLIALGLDQLLPYDVPCPEDNDKIVSVNTYRAGDDLGLLFTPKWLDHMRATVKYPVKPPQPKDQQHPIKTVAVHIRRGDVGVCRYYADRYIPNKYYLETIDEFIQKENKKDPNARFNVTIFTEKDSFESVDEFKELGFNVHLEDDLPSIWASMMVADIFIMGRSSFSTVPGLLNTHGTVVYAPYRYIPLKHWKMAKRETIAGITPEVERLRKDGNPCKGQYNWKKRERVYDVVQ